MFFRGQTCMKFERFSLWRACMFRCTIACFTCSYLLKLMFEVPNLYTRIFWWETYGHDLRRINPRVLEEDSTCSSRLSNQVPTNEGNQQTVGPSTHHRLERRLTIIMGIFISHLVRLWSKPRTSMRSVGGSMRTQLIRWWWPAKFFAWSRPSQGYTGTFN